MTWIGFLGDLYVIIFEIFDGRLERQDFKVYKFIQI